MALPISLHLCSDDDRANLMWKRYLEREDSKIVGMEQGTATGKISSGGWDDGCQLERKKMILPWWGNQLGKKNVEKA